MLLPFAFGYVVAPVTIVSKFFGRSFVCATVNSWNEFQCRFQLCDTRQWIAGYYLKSPNLASHCGHLQACLTRRTINYLFRTTINFAMCFAYELWSTLCTPIRSSFSVPALLVKRIGAHRCSLKSQRRTSHIVVSRSDVCGVYVFDNFCSYANLLHMEDGNLFGIVVKTYYSRGVAMATTRATRLLFAHSHCTRAQESPKTTRTATKYVHCKWSVFRG